ncbi:MAG TPA: heavy-metal-associated domain-containing protein [Gammaproteobacteria bacterium]|nr:heavy-metal-associated domain-containing protein [Gammaproteobacteria bacterium]
MIEATPTGSLAEIELLISNMVCEGCANKIKSTLVGLPGVREVKPKVKQKHVTVRYEPAKIQEQQIKECDRKNEI